MAEDEVKIRLTAEDRFSRTMERNIKMVEGMAKKYTPLIKAAERYEKQAKRVKDIELKVRAKKAQAEYDRLEKKFQHLKKVVSRRALILKVGVQDRVDRNLERIKAKTKFLKRPFFIAISLKDRFSMKLAKIQGKAKWARSKLRVLKGIPASIRDRASPIIAKIRSKAKVLGKAKKMVITAKDKASRVIGGLKTKLGGLMSMASKGLTIGVTVVGAGALSALKDGMNLEQQQTTIEHFIGVNNKGMSQAQVGSSADQYMKHLRETANKTPFSTSEVIQGGTRALTATGGDQGAAKQMLGLAQDMASAFPEKSIMDATEALADAQLGEMARLQEFGFKGSKEQFDAAGGDIFKMQSVDGKNLSQVFNGLAEKQSETAGGMWSTIVGSLGNIKADIGTKLLDKIKPGLSKAVSFLEGKGPEISEKISSMFGDGFNSMAEIGSEVWGHLEPLIDTIGDTIEELSPTFESIKETLGTLFDSAMENAVPILQRFIEFVGPIFEKLWHEIIKPFIDWFVEQMPSIKTAFQEVTDFLQPKIETLIDLWALLGPIIATAWEIAKTAIGIAWDIISPILDWLWDKLQKAIDKVEDMKEKYGPALEAVAGFFKDLKTGIEDSVGWILEKVGAIIDKAKEAKEWLGGLFEGEGDELTTTERQIYEIGANYGVPKATGIRNVPRDNYPTLLHKGEAVIPARDNRGNKDGSSNITIAKLADTVVVREDADIDKIANALVRKIKNVEVT